MAYDKETPGKNVAESLRAHERADKQLSEGSDTFLGDNLFFSEQTLLRLIRALYSQRLEQLGAIYPEETIV